MQKLSRDIGSSFYTLHEDDWEYQVLSKHPVAFNQHISFYYSGRNAFLAILKDIEAKQGIANIWLPNYYCDTVVNMIRQNYDNVQFYEVNPFGDFDITADFKAFTEPKDVIVLNNFWGLSSFKYDSNKKNRATVIEDHSHGWLSEQSLNSKADYCICAIRKSYPIPTGGISWRPNTKNSLDFYEDAQDDDILDAWNKFSVSMGLKRRFIKENDVSVKEEYLLLLNQGEALLSKSNHYIQPLETVIDIYQKYINKDPNKVKNTHLDYIGNHLEDSEHFKVIKREGFIAFGLLLLFKNENIFLDFKHSLIRHGIYPAHLWPNNKIHLEWKYLFNIHVDFRYTEEDMNYIINTINSWNYKTA